MTGSSLLPSLATADDVAVARLVLLAGAVPERGDAPRGDRVTARRGRALAAAVRVVDRVHRRAAGLRAHAHVTLAAGLADRDVLVLGVADDADGGAALAADHPHLAARQTQGRHALVLRHELRGAAGGAHHLRAAAGLELDVVDRGADRHVGQRQAVADARLDVLAADHRRADLQTARGDDVALDAVGVMQQRDVRRAVGVVLDRGDLGGDVVLAALEVDAAVQALGPAAAVARGLAAVGVAPAGLRQAFGQRLLRLGLGDLGEVGIGDEAAAGAGGLGLADRHRSATPRARPGPGRSGSNRPRAPRRWPSSTRASAPR